jgi:hypothetical protein
MENDDKDFDYIVSNFNTLTYSEKLELWKSRGYESIYNIIYLEKEAIQNISFNNFKELNYAYSINDSKIIHVKPQNNNEVSELLEFLLNNKYDSTIRSLSYSIDYELKYWETIKSHKLPQKYLTGQIEKYSNAKRKTFGRVDFEYLFYLEGYKCSEYNCSFEEFFMRFFSIGNYCFLQRFEDVLNSYFSFNIGYFDFDFYVFLLEQQERLNRGEDITKPKSEIANIKKVMEKELESENRTRKSVVSMIHYLDKQGIWKRNKLHQDQTKQAEILSFITGYSANTIRQLLVDIDNNRLDFYEKNLPKIEPLLNILKDKI